MREMRDNDYMKRLSDYIRKNFDKGYTEDDLRYALLSQGYSKMEITNAISIIKEEREARIKAVEKEKPKITRVVEPLIEEEKGFFSKFKSWFK